MNERNRKTPRSQMVRPLYIRAMASWSSRLSEGERALSGTRLPTVFAGV